MEKKQHVWQFSRIGGVNRVALESGADLVHLESLDQKLWTALSCPVVGLEFDAKTLQLIDKDQDGKLRVPDILEAVKWIVSLVKNPDDLVQRKKAMPLAAIKDDTALGKTLYESAKQILINLGKEHVGELTVEETSNTAAIFANTAFNGDGVITVNSTQDATLQTWISHIMACAGTVPDRSGSDGISAAQLDSFVGMCTSFVAWRDSAEADKAAILPFGNQTEKAYNLYLALKSKIEDYFLRCQLAEFDPESTDTLNMLSARVSAINNKDISTCMSEIEGFPIAKIEANKPLSFETPINPAWRDKLFQLKAILDTQAKQAVVSLSEAQWKDLAGKFAAYQSWKSSKAGAEVESLGLDAIRSFLASTINTQITELLDKDVALADEASNIILVDKLVRYYCHIYTILNNFVTFADFYSPDFKSFFQSGTLYFDQRSCDLCIKVSDMAKHGTMAAGSGICLVYLDCVSKTKNEKMTIAAAFTDGDVDDLTVGRNAIFYDNTGLDWDATIVKIVDNPISIRQAFWSPYRKMAKLISKQIEKIAASQDEKVSAATSSGIEQVSAKTDASLQQTVKPTTPADPAAAAAPPAAAATPPAEEAKTAPFDIAKFAGIFAAIGLAFGAIGSVLASFVGGFLALEWWKIPLAFLGIILVISGPSMVLAWLKLRKRNLAPVLDANGWAINAKAIISIPFGVSLTHLAKLPKNSKMNLTVPFNEQQSPVFKFVIIGLLLALVATAAVLWYLGFFHSWGWIK